MTTESEGRTANKSFAILFPHKSPIDTSFAGDVSPACNNELKEC